LVAGSLSGQVAMISGGLGDIGRCLASELARLGAALPIGDIRPKREADHLMEEVSRHSKAIDRQVNVADRKSVESWVAETEANLGCPTVVVPNAAVVTLGTVANTTGEDWDRQIAINLTGSFHFAQTYANQMRKANRPGRIVFIGSWVAGEPDNTILAYCVSKAGVRMLMRCLAKELAPYDILVNEVAPGDVDAGVTAQVFRDDPSRRPYCEARVPVRCLMDSIDVATIANGWYGYLSPIEMYGTAAYQVLQTPFAEGTLETFIAECRAEVSKHK
jgi:glucose 1-dehydrogenase